MTYFLEKYYNVDTDGQLHPSRWYHCLVRPCKMDYDDILNAYNRKSTMTICLDGQIACYSEKTGKCGPQNKPCMSVEEWLIWLNIEKDIVPDFEETHILANNSFNDYMVKTIDLHTNEVLYDSLKSTIKMLKKEAFDLR